MTQPDEMPKMHSTAVKRTSDLLLDVTTAPDKGKITINDFVGMLGDRSIALAILILSLPNILPIGIPGFSTITGVAIAFMALQILGGRKSIWLPRKVGGKGLQQKFLTKMIRKTIPAVLWLEKFLHPRLTILCGSIGERFSGFLILVMACVLSLPVFGGNFLPGLSISLLALALLEDDGVFAAMSMIFCVVSMYVMYEMLKLVIAGAKHWILGAM